MALVPRWLRCIVLLLSIGLTAGCSTQKAKWANIQYHNTTCHYNVWWNGNESLKAGREKLYKSATDDYTQMLTVEPLGTIENARSVNPEMDRAIEKSIKGVKKHSIFVGGEEHVQYIKECYLLASYASFYKQDYVSTVNTCNILVSQFSGTRAGDEGAVLLARCMTREKRYAEAEAALDQLMTSLDKGNFNSSQRSKLYAAMVETCLPQKKYKKAVEYIHLAIDASRDRRQKARLTYILAQIYQELDKRSVAAKYFHQVQGYSPDYVMEFNARLGEASCADMEHSDIARIEKQLDAMLREKKNEEYKDQILYAKGEMYMGAKDAQKACDNFRASCAASTVNKAQKAKSAIRLGEILYELYENYDMAQVYYDTAIQLINSEYPNYKQIRRRYDLLTELVGYTRVYERNDSLMAVATMPEAERLALINGKIEELRKAEEAQREKALLEELRQENAALVKTLEGDWYFYNQNTLQKGKESFRQKWGVRLLEDYWALSNKNMIGMLPLADDNEEDEEGANADADSTSDSTSSTINAGNPNDPHNVAYYLKELPTTSHAIDSIDSLNSLSLLGAGFVFYDGLHNQPRALECYLRMAKDYTSYDEVVQAFYMLYRIYDRQGNTPQANYYRDMVLMGFPDSDFANLIRDNEYYKEILARDKRIEEDYQEVYELYERHRYKSVIGLAEQAEDIYEGSPMLHKFRYWKGLALAKSGNKKDAITELEHIVSNASRADSIVPLAQAQLALLRNDSLFATDNSSEEITVADEERLKKKYEEKPATPQPSIEDELPPESLVYRYRENQQFYVVIIVNDKTVKATELQYRLADFNSKYYSNMNYKVNALLFTDTTQLITIHRFTNPDEAMGYYQHLKQDESPLRKYSDNDHTEFFISTQNYATFYNRKNIEAYMAFFRKYYIKTNN